MSANVLPPLEEIDRWHVPPGECGAEQMAFDETMLRFADRPVVRIYRWTRAELTFGYPQRWEEARAFAGGRPFTRRATGGGFVEHGADLTIALAVPTSHPFARLSPAESYRRIHEAIRLALGDADLRLAGCADCSAGPVCFSSPAPFDVLRGGRKILGGAQRRSREGFLYQGSLLDSAAESLATTFGANGERWEPPGKWRDLTAGLVNSRYGNDAWNCRR